MATLSNADKQNLNADQQAAVLKAKQDWEAANAAGDTAAMEKAHAAAEAVRASSANGAYSGGTSGNAYVSKSNGNNNPYMSSSTANGNSTLSGADNALLNADQQQQLAALKAQWAQANAAGNQAAMDAAHQQAEAIRQSAGYSGGANGAGYRVLGATNGGMTADDMAKWLADYQATNTRKGVGWTNGYDVSMNVRTKANKIRQQMEANEKDMANADPDTKSYLHQQNLALAQLLYQYAGHTDKTTWYNEEKGRWETMNPDVGYGYNVSYLQPSIRNSMKDRLGYTDEDLERYATDTSLYYNFVDPHTVRLATDESSGYTGKYKNFVNGPYLQLLRGSHPSVTNMSVYADVTGDGFGSEGAIGAFHPIRDENGNVINTKAPEVKNNNAMTDYTNQFTSYVQGGVIQPGLLAAQNPGARGTDAYGAYTHKTGGYVDASDPRYTGGVNRDAAGSTAEDPNNIAGQLAIAELYANSPLGRKEAAMSASTGGGGTYEDYINQMYAAALEAQMEQLKSSYDQNISELDASKGKVDDTYTEQKRQTTGTNAQEAANWREMANAYGLNSGTIGQAALAQSNQLQSNLNTLESAQAAAQAEIERQRTLLGQQYQLQINQAMSENNFQRAEALYQEAVRADEALRQQQQFNANLALQYAQLAQQQSQFDAEMSLNYAKAAASAAKSGGGSGGDGSGAGYIAPERYVLDDMFKAAYQGGGGLATLSSKEFRKKYGFGDYNANDVQDQYNRWLGTLGGTGLNNLRTMLSSSHTMGPVEKNDMAWLYYQNGEINYDQLNQILNELGTGA